MISVSDLSRRLKVDPERLKRLMVKLDVGSGNRTKLTKEEAYKLAALVRGELPVEQTSQLSVVTKPTQIKLPHTITVKALAAHMALSAEALIRELFTRGMIITINQTLDYETAALIAGEFGIEVTRDERDHGDQAIGHTAQALVPEVGGETRSPIVTIMGHVDHGKTTLLDYLRHSQVALGESGGITQHIGAYQIETPDKTRITFLDTPGHEAFIGLRRRGASVTDIAVIVVAADDGVKPQTLEAILHAKEANVPILIAINKIDVRGTDPDRVRRELAEKAQLLVEGWGGAIPSIPISAKTGQGIPELLTAIQNVAASVGLTANPERSAIGTVVESHIDPTQGPVATLLVRTGTLKVNDPIVIGTTYGVIREMKDDRGRVVRAALPSMPVRVFGLKDVPEVGESFTVVADRGEAKARALKLRAREKPIRLALRLRQDAKENHKIRVNFVLRTDVAGSLEAITDAVEKLATADIEPRFVDASVGEVSVSDVELARAADATILAFNVRSDPDALRLAKETQVTIHTSKIIYELFTEVKRRMEAKLPPEIVEKVTAKVKVIKLFAKTPGGLIVGGEVLMGVFKRGEGIVRLRGEGGASFTVHVVSLKRGDVDITTAKEGEQIGMKIKTDEKMSEGDMLEVVVTEKRVKTL